MLVITVPDIDKPFTDDSGQKWLPGIWKKTPCSQESMEFLQTSCPAWVQSFFAIATSNEETYLYALRDAEMVRERGGYDKLDQWFRGNLLNHEERAARRLEQCFGAVAEW